MVTVVIDDERTFDTNIDVIYLRSSDEALAWLAKWWLRNVSRPMGVEEDFIQELWFDHDLGDGDDASVVAKFLYELKNRGDLPMIKTIMVHSQNPVGARNLADLLYGCARHVQTSALPKLK